ncbi:hypothetical protein [Dysgonomonas sp. ZJ279]|uniref:hypothetical protein n=1 Tax=Dysgonomonas sp. ZJ279 TaxID=2709796 RepID=UPI0013EA2F34|nr:hypothetical protein [Dysgonomonas sp. ZJ279]
MKMKRFFLTVAFIIGIALCNSSCSQEDEMDQGGSAGGGLNSTLKEKRVELPTNSKNDSINYIDFELK